MEVNPDNNIVTAGKYQIRVIYEDNHLLVVCKPVNMPTQADASGDIDLQTALKGYIKEKYAKPGDVFLALCHRLDRPAGGLMALCRTSKAAARMSEKFASRDVDKRYLCVIRGELRDSLELTDWLLKGEDGNVRVVPEDTPGAKRAQLAVEPVSCADGLTLARVKLFTGRAHQIRVQLAHAGYPLWGDNRYGGGKPGQQLALWAETLAFEHPVRREPLSFTSAPPHTEPWTRFEIDT